MFENLNADFAALIAELPSMTEQLLASEPLTQERISKLQVAGVYSFFRSGKVEYVGRTRNFRKRHKNHCHESSKENTAAFAFRLARLRTDNAVPSYKSERSRKHLMTDPVFLEAFTAAKREILQMEVRFVEVSDPKLQHMLELYASIELQSAHNSFETT